MTFGGDFDSGEGGEQGLSADQIIAKYGDILEAVECKTEVRAADGGGFHFGYRSTETPPEGDDFEIMSTYSNKRIADTIKSRVDRAIVGKTDDEPKLDDQTDGLFDEEDGDEPPEGE